MAKAANIPFYMLVNLPHEEAKLVNLQVELVSEGRLERHMRPNTGTFRLRLLMPREKMLQKIISVTDRWKFAHSIMQQ